MSRIPRIIVPNLPHHVTQRGNRRQQTFFDDEDYRNYIQIMRQSCTHYKVAVLAYCLMPNHVHIIAVPPTEDSLRQAIGDAHHTYTLQVNNQMGWRGHLWQGRFFSNPMEGDYLASCIPYVELNPVRAKLSETPASYPWGSAWELATNPPKPLTDLQIRREWGFLDHYEDKINVAHFSDLRRHVSTGRPLGSSDFLAELQAMTGRSDLVPKKRGPKRLS